MNLSLRTVRIMLLVCLFSTGIFTTVLSAETALGPAAISLRPMPSGTITISKALAASTTSDASPTFDSSLEQDRRLPTLSPQSGWPSPVHDQENRLFVLVDALEYRPRTGAGQRNDGYRWDMEGWYGGDYNRLWFKSEGENNTAFKAGYDVDFQLLYGRFIRKYYDLQIGGRVETQSFGSRNVTRSLGVIGIEGLVPYDYDFESALFIAQNGAVSARLSFTKDLLLTQRLILQGRFETNAAVQRVEEFTTGSGLNNLEFGLRLRYEIRREFAPYIGFSLDKSFGETATLVRQEGGDPSQIRLVAGVRMWF
jgi:copper resistance protein B